MLPNDIARCLGVGSEEDGEWKWREGCADCQRMDAIAEENTWYIHAPAIINFECEYRIEP